MADEWYYSVGDQRSGPVSSAELKRLADTGKLQPTALVWKEGMPQWALARAVRGLFPGAPPLSGPALPVINEPGSVRRRRGLKGMSVDWHPLDPVISAARNVFPHDLAEQISVMAGGVGMYVLYTAAVLTLLGGAVLAIRTNMLGVMLFAVASSVGILVGQYVANRLLGAVRSSISASRSVMGSLAIPDSVFIVAAVATVAHVVRCLYEAIQTRAMITIVEGVAVLIVGFYTALVAITPTGIGVDVDPKCRAGQEAVGVLGFLFKLILRCTPLAFAAGVIYATWGMVMLTYRIITADSESLGRLAGQASVEVVQLAGIMMLPLAAYAFMLSYYVTLDVVAAIVSLPGKLDALASKPDDTPDA